MYLTASNALRVHFDSWQKKPSDLNGQVSQFWLSSRPYGECISDASNLRRVCRARFACRARLLLDAVEDQSRHADQRPASKFSALPKHHYEELLSLLVNEADLRQI